MTCAEYLNVASDMHAAAAVVWFSFVGAAFVTSALLYKFMPSGPDDMPPGVVASVPLAAVAIFTMAALVAIVNSMYPAAHPSADPYCAESYQKVLHSADD